MTTRNWVVVANAARARVLSTTGDPAVFETVADLVHPESRQTAVAMAEAHGGSRPGHVEGTGHGLGSASYQPRTDPREREHDKFAHELAALLNQGVADGRCGGLVLVASDPFLGRLKAHLGTQAAKAVLRMVPSDCTLLSELALARRLGWAPA